MGRGGDRGLEPQQIFGKVDLLRIDNDTEKKKEVKKYKILETPTGNTTGKN